MTGGHHPAKTWDAVTRGRETECLGTTSRISHNDTPLISYFIRLHNLSLKMIQITVATTMRIERLANTEC